MKVSVIMAACNQGKWLGHTVEYAKAGLRGAPDWEIIVIDDQSTDDCCKGIEQPKVRIVRPEQKLGVSAARHLAGTMADGDVIVSTDTHCTFPNRLLWRLAKNRAHTKRAIIVPRVDLEGKHCVAGGRLAVSRRGLRMDLPRSPARMPALYGSVYVMSRHVFDRMGGWLELPGHWGGEEQINTLVAYRIGIPIHVADDLSHVTHHQYRAHNQYPWPLPKTHPGAIAYYTHAACLPETFSKYWKLLLDLYYGPDPEYDAAIEKAKSLAAWIEDRAVITEVQLLDTCVPAWRSLCEESLKAAKRQPEAPE